MVMIRRLHSALEKVPYARSLARGRAGGRTDGRELLSQTYQIRECGMTSASCFFFFFFYYIPFLFPSQQVITVNGARILRPDIQATNGVIHIIDRVLFPVPQADIYSTLKADPQQRYTTLVAAIEKAGLTSALADPAGKNQLSRDGKKKQNKTKHNTFLNVWRHNLHLSFGIMM